MKFDDIVDDGIDTIYNKDTTNNLKSVIEIVFIMTTHNDDNDGDDDDYCDNDDYDDR